VDKTGKSTPVVVTAAKLAYVDSERRAHFTGGVVAKGAEVTVSADSMDVILNAAGSGKTSVNAPSQLNQIVAQNHVAIQETGRRATGEKLVYTAADGKFVLTGGPPMVADATHGTIRGDSLTFYSHDDRIVVESKQSSRTVTHTRVTR
jgi:lipopolysaccharide export system protein LptA